MSKSHTFLAFSTIFLVAALLVNSCSGPVCETTVTSSSLLCLPPRKRGLEPTSSLPLFTGAGGLGLLRLKEFPGLLNLNPLNKKKMLVFRRKQDQTLLWTCVAGACRCVNSRYAKFKHTGMKSDYIQITQCNLQ